MTPAAGDGRVHPFALFVKDGMECPLLMATDGSGLHSKSPRASLARNRKRLRQILAEKQRQMQEPHSGAG